MVSVPVPPTAPWMERVPAAAPSATTRSIRVYPGANCTFAALAARCTAVNRVVPVIRTAALVTSANNSPFTWTSCRAPPPLVNLDVAAGPFQSSQISIVNGRMSQSRTLTYVLQPRAVGKAEIGAVQAGGQSTAPIAIEVVQGAIRPREQPRQDPFGRDPFGDPFEDIFGARRRTRSETLRVAFASDFHAGPATPWPLIENGVETIRELRPHVLLLGGDFVSINPHDAERLAALLENIEANRILREEVVTDMVGRHR